MLNPNRLRELIKSSQYRTLNSFAESLGMTPKGLQKILKEGHTKEETFNRICALLDVEPTDIASDEYLDVMIRRQTMDAKTGIGERIRQLINYLKINDSQFSVSINTPKQTLFSIIDRDNCQLIIIQRILTAYPDLSAAWLVMGQNDVFIKQTPMQVAAEPKIGYGEVLKRIADMENTISDLKKQLE